MVKRVRVLYEMSVRRRAKRRAYVSFILFSRAFYLKCYRHSYKVKKPGRKKMGRYDFLLLGGTGIQGKICARDLLESGYTVLLSGREKKKLLLC
jgi:hypothetical protein